MFPWGPGGGSGDNVSSLANNTVRGLGTISPSPVTSPASDWVVGPIKIRTGTSPSAGGTIEMHLVVSTDGSIFTGGVNPAVGADQATAWAAAIAADPSLTATQILTVTATSNADYYFREFSVVGVLGYVPDYWSLLIFNKSGAALNATAGNHDAHYRAETYV